MEQKHQLGRVPVMRGLDWNEPIPPGVFRIVGDARDVLACYGDDNEPRTRVNLVIEPVSSGQFVRRPLEPLQARLSLREICQYFPKHVTGTGLRLFIQARWSSRKIYGAMREEDRPISASRTHPEMPIQAALSREKIRIAKEMEGSYPLISGVAGVIEREKERLRWQALYNPAFMDPRMANLDGSPRVLQTDLSALGTEAKAQKETVDLAMTTLVFRPKPQTQKPSSDAAIPYVVSPDRIGEDDHKRYVELALEHGWDTTPIEVIEAIIEEFGYPDDDTKGPGDVIEGFILDDMWSECELPQDPEAPKELELAHAFDLPEDFEFPLDFDFNVNFGRTGETDHLQDVASSPRFNISHDNDVAEEPNPNIGTGLDELASLDEYFDLLSDAREKLDNSNGIEMEGLVI